MKLLTSIAFGSLYLVGATSPAVAQDAAAGKAAYAICAACHGADGGGNKDLGSPAIAGQEDWYVIRQLENFKAGIRGTHASDTYGMQMRPMALTLADAAAVANIAAYVSSLAPGVVTHEGTGDAAAGKTLFVTCAVCHGAAAEGNKDLNAPKLTILPDWYIVRQLKNFKAGIRGAHAQDLYGMQMRPMALILADDAAVWNVAAYVASLR